MHEYLIPADEARYLFGNGCMQGESEEIYVNDRKPW